MGCSHGQAGDRRVSAEEREAGRSRCSLDTLKKLKAGDDQGKVSLKPTAARPDEKEEMFQDQVCARRYSAEVLLQGREIDGPWPVAIGSGLLCTFSCIAGGLAHLFTRPTGVNLGVLLVRVVEVTHGPKTLHPNRPEGSSMVIMTNQGHPSKEPEQEHRGISPQRLALGISVLTLCYPSMILLLFYATSCSYSVRGASKG